VERWAERWVERWAERWVEEWVERWTNAETEEIGRCRSGEWTQKQWADAEAVGGRRNGSGRRSRLRGYWQTDSCVNGMKTGPAVSTYRELSIPGEDDFCLEYIWRLEGFAGFPGTDEDSLDPALEEELTLSLEATAQAIEQHGMDAGGTVVDLYRSTNPD
jgi:hypothetical protein